MISRRRILSRSRDDLSLHDPAGYNPEDEEDVWYNKDKLYKDHIQEVLDKWTQIDDEIWAKVVVLERNRRVAKAYARVPVLTINGSDDGFDGYRIGLCGFDNPMRDAKTDELKKHIGHGVKLKMDDQGNILVKRVSKSNVYIKSTSDGDENSIGNEILKSSSCALELEKPVKLFDMKKFQSNVSRELRRAYPDRRRLECQCLSAIAFVKSENELLDCPIWVLIINVVAMDMLKSKLPPVKRAVDIKNRPRIPLPDEDPYSVAGSGLVAATREQLLSQQKNRDRPPKLPPRDNGPYPHDIPKPDYDDIEEEEEEEEENQLVMDERRIPSSRGFMQKSKEKKYSSINDDPYYCGMRARVPNFAKLKVKENKGPPPVLNRYSVTASISNGHLASAHPSHHNTVMWHARSFDSGMDSELLESPYIYGKLPIPTRGLIPATPRTMYNPVYVRCFGCMDSWQHSLAKNRRANETNSNPKKIIQNASLIERPENGRCYVRATVAAVFSFVLRASTTSDQLRQPSRYEKKERFPLRSSKKGKCLPNYHHEFVSGGKNGARVRAHTRTLTTRRTDSQFRIAFAMKKGCFVRRASIRISKSLSS
ncbi:hypothetical protein V9T40_007479 [Parthenolecanium corni]|uniref:MH2 domain-containing protein n=1 Tax=Parthenolecanium corni TaxID=536013 RepID=A0AAN9TJD2_9HEMI